MPSASHATDTLTAKSVCIIGYVIATWWTGSDHERNRAWRHGDHMRKSGSAPRKRPSAARRKPKSSAPRKRKVISYRGSQKLERRQAILDAAKSLIATKGYERATIEDIASMARLSPATVYNYFGAKLDLLLALYVEDRDIAHDKVSKIIERRWNDPLDLFLAIMEADLHEEVEAVSHPLWRQIAAAEAIHTKGRYRLLFQRMNDRYAESIILAIRSMVERGLFRGDVDIAAAKDIFINVSDGLYRKIIATENKPFSGFRSDARKQLHLLMKAMKS